MIRKKQMQNSRLSPNAVSLNDFAANADGVLSVRQWPSFVWELMLYSLLRDEVLIQDEALVLSDKFARIFSNRSRFHVLEELFDMGTLIVLKQPVASYPEADLQELALSSPLVARAAYLERHSTKGANRFIPSPEQRYIHSTLDGIISRAPLAHREAGERSGQDMHELFSAALANVLGDPRTRPWLLAEFHGTTHRVLDDFATYVAEPQVALKRIVDNGRVPQIGVDAKFTRSIGYQVAASYPRRQERGMQHLIQSAFAFAFNEREDAIGRYSSALRELPTVVETVQHTEDIPPTVTIDALVRTPLRLPLPLPGFARIISDVRATQAGRRLREVIRSRNTTAFEEQQAAWQAVAHELALRTTQFKPIDIASVVASVPKAVATGVMVEGIYQPHSLLDPTFWESFGVKRTFTVGINVAGDLIRQMSARWHSHKRFRQILDQAVQFRTTDLKP
jgi:hypothetical protein